MNGQIILGLIVGLPLALGLLFRVSTSHIFFSLMAGELLSRYFGNDFELQTNAFSQQVSFNGYGEIALLTIPMILTAFFLRKSISGGKTILHVLPLIITGVIFAAFIAPILPIELQNDLRAFKIGDWLFHLNKAIIGIMITMQLIALWLFSRGENSRKEKRRK